MLADALSPFISDLFPADAEIVDDGNRRMRISWRAPVEGRPNRRATPIAIHFENDLVDAIRAATDFEREYTIGPRFRGFLRQAISDYDPNAGVEQAFVVVADMGAIGG